MRGIQKLANRVTAGLVIAALIIGAAMLMRIDTEAKLFGYPGVAIVSASWPRPPPAVAGGHQPAARPPQRGRRERLSPR